MGSGGGGEEGLFCLYVLERAWGLVVSWVAEYMLVFNIRAPSSPPLLPFPLLRRPRLGESEVTLLRRSSGSCPVFLTEGKTPNLTRGRVWGEGGLGGEPSSPPHPPPKLLSLEGEGAGAWLDCHAVPCGNMDASRAAPFPISLQHHHTHVQE